MTITYILQILDDIEKGDSKKYGVITDMNGELQKAVRRARRRITRLRFRAQYELGEMDKAKVAAANDHMPRFIRVLDKIRNLNLEDCRGLQGIEDFLDDENRVHEVVEMAQKIGQLSVISSSAYTPMALGFGLLETQVRSICHYLEDIAQCAKEKADAINDLADYFADGVESAERIQMQAGGDWAMYTLVQKMQIGRAIQVAQLITLLFQRLLDSDGQIYESSRAAIKKAQDELLKRDA